jgi:hypothetical protein
MHILFIGLLACILDSGANAMEHVKLTPQDENCIQMLEALKYNPVYCKRLDEAKQNFEKSSCPLCKAHFHYRANAKHHFFMTCLPKHPEKIKDYQPLMVLWQQEKLSRLMN